MKKLIIAVDFDGTCVTHAFPKVGRDIGAQVVLKELVENGHKLILYTMRSDKTESHGFSDEVPEVHVGTFLTDAINWFKKNDIPLWSIQVNPEQSKWTSSPKCYAQVYIDDAALGAPLINDPTEKFPYVDWNQVRKLLVEKGILMPKGEKPNQN